MLVAPRKRSTVKQYPTTIGEHIRKIRIERGLTQKEVAKFIGVTSDQICSWEIGRNQIRQMKYFPKLINFLGYIPDLENSYSIGRDMTIVKQIHGWNNRQLAGQLGIDEGTVRKWIQGEYQILTQKQQAVCLKLKELMKHFEV